MDKLGRIIKLAHEISETKIADVFVDYSGHVKLLGVRVFIKGWSKTEHPSKRFMFYLDDESSNKLDDVLDLLTALSKGEAAPAEKAGQCSLCRKQLYFDEDYEDFYGSLVCKDCYDEIRGLDE